VWLPAKTTLGEGFPAFGVYGASKAAVRSFARTWTVDLKARNIRVNTLSPGTINTNILAGVPRDAMDYFTALVPRPKIGEPEEIATATLFLASSDSSFVTGIELFVDRASRRSEFAAKDPATSWPAIAVTLQTVRPAEDGAWVRCEQPSCA